MKKIILISITIGFLVGCGGGNNTPSQEKDSDKDGIVDIQDNCINIANKNQLDTDNDGKGNVCDNDDDNDGFNDKIDPAPLDASNPGDFSSPEAILNYPPMKKVLKSVRDNGIEINTELGLTPPDITGYYKKDSGTGTFLATGNKESVGNTIVGYEFRFDVYPDHKFDSARSSFSENKHLGFSLGKGAIIRGEGDKFSIYTLGKGTCTEDDSNYSMYYVKISSGNLANNKDILDTKSLAFTVATEGNLTHVCADRWSGDGEYKDGWSLSTYDINNRIEDVNDLEYMCIDENKAYVPTETWINSNKQSCTCTSEYKVSCGG